MVGCLRTSSELSSKNVACTSSSWSKPANTAARNSRSSWGSPGVPSAPGSIFCASTLRRAARHPEEDPQRRRARSRLSRFQLEHPPGERRHRSPFRPLASPQPRPENPAPVGLFSPNARQTHTGTESGSGRHLDSDPPSRDQKKGAAGATLVVLDEVGFSLKGTVKHTWALGGQTPVVFGKASGDKVSTTLRGHECRPVSATDSTRGLERP